MLVEADVSGKDFAGRGGRLMDQHRDWMAWQVLVVSLPSSFSLGSMKLPQFVFFFFKNLGRR